MSTVNESTGMAMSIESGGLAALIAKFGLAKVIGFGAAGVGALMMAAFRPPQTRKEMFWQAVVALGSSLLFGTFFVSILANYVSIPADALVAPVHGLLGALSWGAFGGLAHLRDKVGKDPIGTAKEIKDVISK